MAYSNVEKQQRYRQRLREQGLVQVQGWVTPEQAAAIRRIMAARVWEAPRAAVKFSVAPRADQNDP